MDININTEILHAYSFPREGDKFIICFNFRNANQIFNMGVKRSYFWEDDKDAVGVWKIKQLKK